MRDPGSAIRKAFIDALEGNIIMDSAVPIVDNKIDEELNQNDVWINFHRQIARPRHNKTMFVHEVDLYADVCFRSNGTASKRVVEEIADQVFNVLYPTPGTHVLVIEEPFTITWSRVEDDGAEPVEKDTNNTFVTRKTILFRNRITQ